MLVKRNGCFAKVDLMPVRQIVRYGFYSSKNAAMSDCQVMEAYDSIEKLKDDGWEFCKPSLETLSVGDFIGNDGVKQRIMMAQGVGKYRTYFLSSKDDYALTLYPSHTAKEIEEFGFKPLPWEVEDEVEVTVEGQTKRISRKSAIALGLIED